MLTQIKIYLIAGLAIVVGILGFLFKNEQLKRTKQNLKIANKNAEINHEVSKILASRNVVEVNKRVRKEIKDGNTSSLDN